MGKVIAATAYSAGRKVADISIAESGEWANRPGHFVWIGIEAPSEHELRALQKQFGLHELALEDALNAHQRPKVEVYGDTSFLVLRTAFLIDGHIALGETEIFVGKGYVISVRHGASASYTRVRQCAEATPKQLSHGEDYVVYAIVDFIVDNYLIVVEKLAAEVEALEDHVLEPLDETRVARIYELRRELQKLHLVAAPAVEVCRRLEHADIPGIDADFRPYFRDIGDHVNRALEQINSLREMLGFAFEAGLLLESSRQGAIGRRLTGWAAILAVPTAIAGIYGMNFKNMPELEWQYGYFAALGVIFSTCFYLFYRFRKAGWI
ncbi:magnesium and cobalt transport protein CorA [Methylocella silvestris BL2]|uniref:Magnesium and cobalt transport protein CorA n=1 Tax=Methylocella silvestris (strain DSM 15510 / CIP 108128 / LMG 27833 / NCIMB 13906 / BL2) TaxID=395965 RepID=B8EKI1_METSB|nr:magnesium and cobalt transport protein CorA [Methylocella silvestris]ACK51351.1 magnesium and cobalt transport protein CorA [Methylocella silvestris BL2]